MSDDTIRMLRAESAQKEAEAKAIEAERAAQVAAQPPAAPEAPAAAPAEPIAPAAPSARPEIGHEPPPGAPIAAAGPVVPQPGARLDSAGLDVLLRDAAAFGRYEDSPGGREELERVSREESKGRRV